MKNLKRKRCPFAIHNPTFQTHQSMEEQTLLLRQTLSRAHSSNPFKNAPSKCYNLLIFPTQQVGPTHSFFNIKTVMSASCIMEQRY